MKAYVNGAGGISAPKKPGDSGYDLHAAHDAIVFSGENAVIDTGAHVEIPDGYAGLVVGRSSLNVRGVFSQLGLIDSSYRGQIKVVLYNTGYRPYEINAGDRVAQLVIVAVATPALELVNSVDALTESERGGDGFGSTGR